jgi:hypothetical protein
VLAAIVMVEQVQQPSYSPFSPSPLASGNHYELSLLPSFLPSLAEYFVPQFIISSHGAQILVMKPNDIIRLFMSID